MKQQIQIFGQRCSGTNYLEQLLLANFENIEIVNYYAFKHIWNANLVREIKKDDGIKIIIIVRNPYNWLRSVHREPHHCPQLVGLPFDQFIHSPWIAYHKSAWNSANPEIRLRNLDKLPILEEFKNVIDLRNKKNIVFDRLLTEFPNNVCLINYESLSLELNGTLDLVEKTFNLSRMSRNFIQISTYKDTNKKYIPKELIKIKSSSKKYIDKLLRFDIENKFGYTKNDYAHSAIFDKEYYKFKLKEFLVKNRFYVEKLKLTESEIEQEDRKKYVQRLKSRYRILSQQDFESKTTVLREILNLDANNTWALLELTTLAIQGNAYEEAMNKVNIILLNEPKNAKALFQKGVILNHIGDLQASLKCHEKVESIRPKWKLNLRKLVSLYKKTGSIEKSENVKKKILNQKL